MREFLIKEGDLVSLDDRLKCHREVLEPLKALIADGRANGFEIAVASAFRDFDRQAAIVLQKFLGQRPVLDRDENPIDISSMSDKQKISAICLFSALPGFSRHHLGTDFDIYPKNLLPEGKKLQLTAREYDKNDPDGYFYPFLDYLRNRLGLFGFVLPYDGRNSVGYEPWHISYKSVAERILKGFSLEGVITMLAGTDLPYKDAAIAYAKDHYSHLMALNQ